MAKKATTKKSTVKKSSKKTTKKTTKKAAGEAKAPKAPKAAGRGGRFMRTERDVKVPDTEGKHLVIVESPTKAKTINKYLGDGYAVMASVGHVRDLPSRAPKGVKQEVPGVDVDNRFEPTYEVMPDKKKTVAALKKAASKAADVWFATDLDREGEAIAWHLAKALNVEPSKAKRVVFNAITREQIQKAFGQPRPIDENKVNAQQARRILDRIVGYQVSPLLWKKVAGGLSAGRVQSVATRLVVDREREIEAFIPDEFWRIAGYFATDAAQGSVLGKAWMKWLGETEGDDERTLKDKLVWLSQNQCLRGELVEVAKEAFKVDNRDDALRIAKLLGFDLTETKAWEDPKGKGTSKNRVKYIGSLVNPPDARIASITTKRTSTRPSAPFITSSMQQAAANRLGFALQRTMRIAQQLYEGIDIHGIEGQTGLITYMRTDSTHVSGEAMNMARSYIQATFGDKYLPDKPNFFASPNKAAQEAHEAIRPTDVSITPQRVQKDLSEDQFKLYKLVWERFVASQMIPAQWDSTAVLIEMDLSDKTGQAVFKANGRTLVEEGFYKVLGLPSGGDEAILPLLTENQPVAPLQVEPTQQFTSPPARFTEASLQKKLEEEGIGRPSTYAAIISTIQDRKYVQPIAPRDKRMYATDLGKVVTDKLIEAFPAILEVAYTRKMEGELDKVEEESTDWVTMLQEFYGPFRESLTKAMELMVHAKAEVEPAPFKCEKCNADTVYRFGKNGRFLSCSRYPDCDYAAPIDREGNPQQPEMTDIVCPLCGGGMTRRTGRFGPFLGCVNYPTCKGILKLDPKKGSMVLPKTPPLTTDVPCTKCGAPLYLRTSKRGFWLSCSTFPKCRGRVAWSALEEDKQKTLEKAWETHFKENPVPVIHTGGGKVVEEGYLPIIINQDSEPEPEVQTTTSSSSDDNE